MTKSPVPELDDGEPLPTGPYATARLKVPSDLFSGEPAPARLLVLGQGAPQTFALDEGRLVVGRAKEADVRIEDESISRRHAILDVGKRLFIEDTGSLNGTRVRERAVPRGERVELHFGEAFELGHVIAIVQRRGAPSSEKPRRRLWPHGYFEARLEEECLRRADRGGTFTVVRFHVHEKTDDALVAEKLEETLRVGDVAGLYAPGEIEVLFLDAPWDDVERICERFVQAMLDAGTKVGTGVAAFPVDGTSGAALLERANRRAGGKPADDDAPRPSQGAMERLKRLIDRVASSDISVVLHGETGVGKEVLAREIHRLSERAKNPFVGLNCASLSETLLESELFGHERGAFTGAVTTKPGLFEVAEKGTVFLDEIGEMPPSIQAKLLRVLEERTVLRVGGLSPRTIDVRFLAASHRDLEADVAAGRFRQDLFFRLNGITLEIPPLRERVDEIEELATRFVADAAKRMRREPAPTLSRPALAMLLSYSWPGNIRELKNVVERAVLLASGPSITTEHLPVEKMKHPPVRASTDPRQHPLHPSVFESAPSGDTTQPLGTVRRATKPPVDVDDATLPWDAPGILPGSNPSQPPTLKLDEAVADAERQRIVEALRRAGGNQTKAAELLGISRRTLINRLDAYKIARPRKA